MEEKFQGTVNKIYKCPNHLLIFPDDPEESGEERHRERVVLCACYLAGLSATPHRDM